MDPAFLTKTTTFKQRIGRLLVIDSSTKHCLGDRHGAFLDLDINTDTDPNITADIETVSPLNPREDGHGP